MDENYHEKIAVKSSRLQVWGIAGLVVLVSVVSTACLILFTPLRQIVPGYTRDELVKDVYTNKIVLDSLQGCVEGQMLILSLLQGAMEGKVPIQEIETAKDSLKDYSNIKYRRSVADSLLRIEVESSDPYTITTMSAHENALSLAERFLFFNPVEGKCIRGFDSQIFTGIDIETRPNEGIKACLPGYVVFTEWSPELGYVIIVQHENHIISIYGNATALLKRSGDFVESGEVIAFAGRRLHFELWYNGFAMNPSNYLTF